MRVLANELGIDNWQWKLEGRKVGLLAFGTEQNRVDIREGVFTSIFQGWGLWSDDERAAVMDFLVRDHFEYWDRSGNPV